MIESIVISRALEQLTYLTLPELGTFFKDRNGEFKFNSLLKVDDKVLESIIINSYQVDRSTAATMVEEFISDIKSKTASGGQYIIPGVGILYKYGVGYKMKKMEDDAPIEESVVQPPVVQVQPRTQVTPQPIVGVPQPPQQHPQRTVQQPRGTTVNPPFVVKQPQIPSPHQPINGRQYGDRRPAMQQRPPQTQRSPQVFGPGYDTRRQPSHSSNNNMPPRYRRQQKPKRVDWLLILAIIVAIIVIILIVYALVFSENPADYR